MDHAAAEADALQALEGALHHGALQLLALRPEQNKPKLDRELSAASRKAQEQRKLPVKLQKCAEVAVLEPPRSGAGMINGNTV